MKHVRKVNIFLLLFDILTFVVWGWIMLDFLTRTQLKVPVFVSTLYLLILAFYVGDKELRRWRRKYHSHARRGEYFVYLWGLTIIAIAAFYVWGGNQAGYRIPQELPSIAGSVLILYILTEYLKTSRK
jgi:peptidoglycan/LPS O-acetylase OafA/YrhL